MYVNRIRLPFSFRYGIEPFWLSVTFQNPISAEITLTNVKPAIAGMNGAALAEDSSSSSSLEIETLPQITLPPKGQVVVSFRITSHSTANSTLSFTSISFNFLSLLPCTESLATKGKRLNDTPAQRLGAVYAPDVLVQIDVREAGARLASRFIAPFEMTDDDDDEDDTKTMRSGIVGNSGTNQTNFEAYQEEISVFDGEIRAETLVVKNIGIRAVSDAWLILPTDGSVWIGSDDEEDAENSNEVLHQSMKAPSPHHLSNLTLQPGETIDVPVVMRHTGEGASTISVLVVFRDVCERTLFNLQHDTQDLLTLFPDDAW